jgi:ABC-type nitrate/sulfonate/bicarbonate transport system permease component
MVLGFVIAVAIGVPAGLLLGRSKWAARIGTPYVNILLVSPTAVFIPLLIIWTGLGLTSRVILVVIIAVPYLIINCRAGITQVSPQLIEMSRVFGSNEWTLWRKILIPAAVPQIMTGLRITLGRAIEGMVVVELIMVAVGLGNLVLDYQATFQPAKLYAVVVYVIVEAVVLVALLRWVERRATPWISRSSAA